MKKVYLLFVVAALLISVSSVNAQKIKFGIKGGLNLASFYGENVGTDTKTGLYIGGFLENKFSEKLSLQAELLYSEKGAVNYADCDFKFKFNYFTVPVVCKYYFADWIILQFGPQFGFNILSDFTDGNVTVDYEEVSGENINTFDFGLNLGAEVFVTKHIALNARYNFGLTEVVNDTKMKNSVMQFGMAYRF